MKKLLFLLTMFFVLTAIVPFFILFSEAKETLLFSQQTLESHGLTREWFNQIGIDSNRNKILYAVVEGDTMFVISDDAKLHVINAETGQSLWMRTLGNREMIFQEPAVNSRMVSVVNGLELFVFDRRNGKLLLQTPLPGASSAAPEMSENYVYIPMMGSRIIVFPLEDVSGPKMEDEGGPGSTTPIGEAETALEPKEPDKNNPNKTGNEDPILEDIVKRFAEVKQSILAESEPPKKEPEIFLRKAIGLPMQNLSFGNVLVKPLLSTQIILYNQRRRVTAHRESVIWITDRGFLFTAGINNLSQELFELQYMVDSSSQTYYLDSERIARREWEKNKELVSRPTANQCIPPLYTDNHPKGSQIPSLVVTGNKEGYVFALKDRTGEVVWQFAADGPIIERIAVIGADVYCPTATGGMHALDLITGKEKWFTSGIHQFISASQERIYSLDRRLRLVILDRVTGNPIDTLDVQKFDRFLFNIETDRLYAVNDTGLIQCLRERQPQTLENILDNKTLPPIRHRLSCKQYVNVLNGHPAAPLYWLDNEKGSDAVTEKTEENDGTLKKQPSNNNTGEDGSLDGNSMEMNIETEPQQEQSADDKNNEKKETKEEPF
jgi:outer membrane protein assembly factor BamB